MMKVYDSAWAFWFFVLVLVLAFAGDPDLWDVIIRHLDKCPT